MVGVILWRTLRAWNAYSAYTVGDFGAARPAPTCRGELVTAYLSEGAAGVSCDAPTVGIGFLTKEKDYEKKNEAEVQRRRAARMGAAHEGKAP